MLGEEEMVFLPDAGGYRYPIFNLVEVVCDGENWHICREDIPIWRVLWQAGKPEKEEE